MHLVYLLVYNIICLASVIYCVDEHKEKVLRLDELINNQKHISHKLKQVYGEEKHKAFDISTVKPIIKQKKQTFKQQLQKEIIELTTKQSQEAIQKSQKRKQLIKKVIMGLCAAGFIYRSLFAGKKWLIKQ